MQKKKRASLQASLSCKTPGDIIGRDYAANFASDVENSNSVRVALKAKRGDCVVNVGDVGVEAAEISFAFCTAFAQCSHRARLYHFEKIEPPYRVKLRRRSSVATTPRTLHLT